MADALIAEQRVIPGAEGKPKALTTTTRGVQAPGYKAGTLQPVTLPERGQPGEPRPTQAATDQADTGATQLPDAVQTSDTEKPLSMQITQIKASGGADAARAAAATEAHTRKQEQKSVRDYEPVEGGKIKRAAVAVGRGLATAGKELARHPIKTAAKAYETVAVAGAIDKKAQRLALEMSATLATEGTAMPAPLREMLRAKAQELKTQKAAEQKGFKGWLTTKVKRAGEILAGQRTAITTEDVAVAKNLRKALTTPPDVRARDPQLMKFYEENQPLIEAYKTVVSGRFDEKQALMESASIRAELGEIAPGIKLSEANSGILAKEAIIPIAEKLILLGSEPTDEARHALRLESEARYIDAISAMAPGPEKDRLISNMAVAQDIFQTAEVLAQRATDAAVHTDGAANTDALKQFFADQTANLSVTVNEITDESLAEIKIRRSAATRKAVEAYMTSGGVADYHFDKDSESAKRTMLLAVGKTAATGTTFGSVAILAGQRGAGVGVRVVTGMFGGVALFAGIAGFRQVGETGRDISAARTAAARGENIGQKGGRTAEIAGMPMIRMVDTAAKLNTALGMLNETSQPRRTVIENALKELAAVDARRKAGDKAGIPLWMTTQAGKFGEEMKAIDVTRQQIVLKLQEEPLAVLRDIAREVGADATAQNPRAYIDAIKNKLSVALQDNLKTGKAFVGEVTNVLNGTEDAVKTGGSLREARRAARNEKIKAGATKAVVTFVVGSTVGELFLHASDIGNGARTVGTGIRDVAAAKVDQAGQVVTENAPALRTLAFSEPIEKGIGLPTDGTPIEAGTPGGGIAREVARTIDTQRGTLAVDIDPSAPLQEFQVPGGPNIAYPGELHMDPAGKGIILDAQNNPIPHQPELKLVGQLPESKNYVFTYDQTAANGTGGWDAVDPATHETAYENINLQPDGVHYIETTHLPEQVVDLPKPSQPEGLPAAEQSVSSKEVITSHASDRELHFNTNDSGGQGFRTSSIDDGNGIRLSYSGKSTPDYYSFTVNGQDMLVKANDNGDLDLHFDDPTQQVTFQNGTTMSMQDFSKLVINEDQYHQYIDGLGVKNGGIATEMHPGGRDIFNAQYIHASTVTVDGDHITETSLATIQGDGKVPAEIMIHQPGGAGEAGGINPQDFEVKYVPNSTEFSVGGHNFDYPGKVSMDTHGNLVTVEGGTTGTLFTAEQLTFIDQLPPSNDFVMRFDAGAGAWDLVNTKQGVTYIENISIHEGNKLHFTPTVFGDIKEGHLEILSPHDKIIPIPAGQTPGDGSGGFTIPNPFNPTGPSITVPGSAIPDMPNLSEMADTGLRVAEIEAIGAGALIAVLLARSLPGGRRARPGQGPGQMRAAIPDRPGPNLQPVPSPTQLRQPPARANVPGYDRERAVTSEQAFAFPRGYRFTDPGGIRAYEVVNTAGDIVTVRRVGAPPEEQTYDVPRDDFRADRGWTFAPVVAPVAAPAPTPRPNETQPSPQPGEGRTPDQIRADQQALITRAVELRNGEQLTANEGAVVAAIAARFPESTAREDYLRLFMATPRIPVFPGTITAGNIQYTYSLDQDNQVQVSFSRGGQTLAYNPMPVESFIALLQPRLTPGEQSLENRFATVNTTPNPQSRYYTATVPQSFPISNVDEYIPDPQVPFIVTDVSGGAGANPLAAPYAFNNPDLAAQPDFTFAAVGNNSDPSFALGEAATDGDSGLFALAKSSAGTPAEQAALYQTYATSILAIHAGREGLLGSWYDNQGNASNAFVTLSSLDRFRDNDFVPDDTGAYVPRPENEQLLRYDDGDRRVPDRDATLALWETRRAELSRIFEQQPVQLEPHHVRWMEFLSHSVNVDKLARDIQAGGATTPPTPEPTPDNGTPPDDAAR